MSVFKERLYRQWNGIFFFIRKYVDVVMWLYILIPGVFFSYFFFRETVGKLEYGILAEMNVQLLVFLILFCCSFLKGRLFIETPDCLFLIQHGTFAKLKRCGYWYAFLLNSVFILVAYTLLFPLFFIVLHYNMIKMVMLATAMLCSYLLCDGLDNLQRKWWRFVLKLGSIFLLTITVLQASLLMFSLVIIVLIFCIYFVDIYTISRHGLFQQQLKLENSREMRFFSLIFKLNKDMQAGQIHYFNKKKPKLFKIPYSKNKSTALIELLLKTIWRNNQYLLSLLLFISIIIPFLIVLPIWINILLIIFFYFGTNGYLDAVANEIKANQIFRMIQYSDEDWFLSKKKFKYYIVTPVIALYSIIVIMKTLIVFL